MQKRHLHTLLYSLSQELFEISYIPILRRGYDEVLPVLVPRMRDFSLFSLNHLIIIA